MSKKQTRKFFADLRTELLTVSRSNRLELLKKVYRSHSIYLPLRLKRFILYGILRSPNNPKFKEAIFAYKSSEEYLDSRLRWLRCLHTGVCKVCSSAVFNIKSPLLNLLTRKQYCSTKCSAKSLEKRDKVTATLLRNYGVTNPSKSEVLKQRRTATMLCRFGVTNASKSKAIRRKKEMTSLSNYGFASHFNAPEVRSKIEATMLCRYGVKNAMQNETVALKVLKASRLHYKGTLKGKKYSVQGKSEIHLLKALVNKFGANDVDSQFSPQYPVAIFKQAGVIPDFYLHSIKTFIECKSTWTLMGRPGTHARGSMEGSLSKNKRKAASVFEAGSKVRWVVHVKDRTFITLPTRWYTWKNSEIRTYVNQRISS